MNRWYVVLTALVVAPGCSPRATGQGHVESAAPTEPTPSPRVAPFLSAPLAGSERAPDVAGSGVPLDAPVTDVPASDVAPMQTLARGSRTPADRALGEGDEAYGRGDFPGAVQAYEKAAKLAPKDPAPIVGIVRSRLSAQSAPTDIGAALGHPGLEQAVADLQRAVRFDERFVPASLELGRTLLVLGRADDAVPVLRRVVELASSDGEAHSAFGVALLATGNVELAVQQFEQAVGIEPHSAVRLKNLGTALLALGKSAEAMQVFEKAAQLAPGDARVQNDLGTALLTLGETDRAISCLQLAVARDPRKATYRSNLGYAWGQKGDWGRAVAIYREALALDERLVSAWINLGNAHARVRDFGHAHEAYERAMAIDPEDPRVKAVVAELADIEKAQGRASTSAPSGGK